MEVPQGDMLKHVQECEACQWNKEELIHPAGLLQPLPIPEGKCVMSLLKHISNRVLLHNFAHFWLRKRVPHFRLKDLGAKLTLFSY